MMKNQILKKKEIDMSMLGVIIGVFITKGGNAKTTTVLEMAYSLRRIWQKSVLLIDLDGQMSASSFLNTQKEDSIGSIFEVLTGERKIADVIQKGNDFDFIASSVKLNDVEAFLSSGVGKDRLLKEKICEIGKKYDVIIIDFPPAASKLSICGMTALNKLILTCQPDPFSIYSLSSTNELYLAVKKYLNPSIELAGILISRYKKTLLSEEIVKAIEEIAENIGTFVYKSRLRESVLVREAQLAKTSVLKYAGNSPVASDILEFMDEFGERYGKEI